MPDIVDQSFGRPQAPLAQVPQAGFSASEIAAPYRALAQAVGFVGREVEDASVELNKQAGEEAAATVTKNADGTVSIDRSLRPFVFSAGDRAFNAALRQGALASAMTSAQGHLAQLHAQFLGDPAGYKNSADAFVKTLAVNSDPMVRNQLVAEASSISTQRHNSLLDAAMRQSMSNAKSALETQVQEKTNTIYGLALAGGMSTPEFQDQYGKLTDLYTQLKGNPVFGYSPDLVASQLRSIDKTIHTQSTLGTVDRVWRADGDAGVEALKRRIVDDPNSPLSMPERQGLANAADGRLAFIKGLTREKIAIAGQKTQAILDGWAKNVPIADAQVEAHISQLTSLGAAEQVAALTSRRAFHPAANALQGATDAERVAALKPPEPRPATFDTAIPGSAPRRSAEANTGYRHIPAVGTAVQFFTSRGWTPEQAAAITGNLLHESGMNTTVAGDGGISVGIAQWNRERLAGLKSYAASVGKPFSDLGVQLEYVDRELRTSESSAGNAIRAARTVEDANAAMLGFERPQGWTAQNPAGGHGYTSRLNNARNIAQATIDGFIPKGDPASVPGGAPVGTATARPVGAPPIVGGSNPYAFSQHIRAVIEDRDAQVARVGSIADAIQVGLKQHDATGLPSAENLAEIRSVFSYTGDAGLRKKLQAIDDGLAGWDLAQRALGQPGGEGEARLARAKELAASGDLRAQAVNRDADAWIAAGVARYKNDWVNEAKGRNWIDAVPVLDLSSAEAIGRTVNAYGRVALSIAAHNPRDPRPLFPPSDLAQVKAAANSGPVDHRIALLAGLAELPHNVRNAALGQLGASGDSAVFALAGALTKVAPEVARSIVVGQSALQTDERFLPSKGPDKVAYSTAKDAGLPVAAFAPALRMDAAGPFAAMSQAIDSRYAYLSAQAGDTSAKANEARLRQAAADVTGGIVFHNGGPVIAPARGMDQRTFDGVIAGLTDADLAGVATGSGRAVTADFVRTSAKLHAIGDGSYLVQLNGNDANPLYAGKGGQPFVLDLRNRQPVALPTRGLPSTADAYGAIGMAPK